MSIIKRLEVYRETYHPIWLDVLRIILGSLLFIKGVQFVGDTETLKEVIFRKVDFEFRSFLVFHYVGFAHLVGGVLIAIGLITRAAILFQLPILIGAIVFINASKGFFSIDSELGFSILILFLLLFFLAYGSGPLSIDAYMKRHKNS